MMVPRKNNTLTKSYLKEVESMTMPDELRTAVKHLVIKNASVSRQLCHALKSMENQTYLVKYLQKALKDRMSGYSKEILKTLTDIGAETLRSVNNFARYQMLAYDLLNSQPLKQLSHENLIEDFKKAVFAVPSQYLEASRHYFIDILSKLQDGGYDDTFDRLDKSEFGDTTEKAVTEPEAAAQRKNETEHHKIKNNRINDFKRNKKEHYRIMAKKNACRTSRKHSIKNLQSNKSQSTSRKKFGYADNEDVQSQKFSRRRKYKRKIEEVNDKSLNSDDEASFAVYKSSVRKAKLAKKMRSSYYSIYTNEPVKLRHCSIELNDFMLDPSADNDPFIAQYKQSCGYKVHEQIELEVLNEASDDTDSDQREESDPISDNNDGDDNPDERVSTKSHESDDNDLEEDANASKLIDSEKHDAEPSNNALSNGKKGPCTPPLSPTPDDYIVRRGPRTPSYSPPVVPRRGPCTPPGAAPTSDSEAIDDEGDSSDSSGL